MAFIPPASGRGLPLVNPPGLSPDCSLTPPPGKKMGLEEGPGPAQLGGSLPLSPWSRLDPSEQWLPSPVRALVDDRALRLEWVLKDEVAKEATQGEDTWVVGTRCPEAQSDQACAFLRSRGGLHGGPGGWQHGKEGPATDAAGRVTGLRRAHAQDEASCPGHAGRMVCSGAAELA